MLTDQRSQLFHAEKLQVGAGVISKTQWHRNSFNASILISLLHAAITWQDCVEIT